MRRQSGGSSFRPGPGGTAAAVIPRLNRNDYEWKLADRRYGDENSHAEREARRIKEAEERKQARETGGSVDLGRAAQVLEQATREKAAVAANKGTGKGKGAGFQQGSYAYGAAQRSYGGGYAGGPPPQPAQPWQATSGSAWSNSSGWNSADCQGGWTGHGQGSGAAWEAAGQAAAPAAQWDGGTYRPQDANLHPIPETAGAGGVATGSSWQASAAAAQTYAQPPSDDGARWHMWQGCADSGSTVQRPPPRAGSGSAGAPSEQGASDGASETSPEPPRFSGFVESIGMDGKGTILHAPTKQQFGSDPYFWATAVDWDIEKNHAVTFEVVSESGCPKATAIRKGTATRESQPQPAEHVEEFQPREEAVSPLKLDLTTRRRAFNPGDLQLFATAGTKALENGFLRIDARWLNPSLFWQLLEVLYDAQPAVAFSLLIYGLDENNETAAQIRFALAQAKRNGLIIKYVQYDPLVILDKSGTHLVVYL